MYPYGILVDFVTNEYIRPATKAELDKTLDCEATGWDGCFALDDRAICVKRKDVDR